VQKVKALFHYDLVRFTREAKESKALNTMHGPMVIIAASGMVETGRILHHLKHGAADSRNTILIVGFQAEGTLGRRIVERQSTLRIFGEEIPLRAQVEVIDGYSAHADRNELAAWLEAVKSQSPKLDSVFLVHGEPEAQDTFKTTMSTKGYHVTCPERHEKHTV
jgi:metallo-beta-lactamase family protein